jgi:hypothetical protein
MAAATKIVIVAGQEFSVPAETDNEAIRSQLAGMGFADVASATIQKGKRKVGDEELETIEFVKKAGTKGLSGAELAALLVTVPPKGAPTFERARIEGQQLVQRLAAATLTIGDALAHQEPLQEALQQVEHHGRVRTEGEALCAACEHLPAVAVPAPFGW